MYKNPVVNLDGPVPQGAVEQLISELMDEAYGYDLTESFAQRVKEWADENGYDCEIEEEDDDI